MKYLRCGGSGFSRLPPYCKRLFISVKLYSWLRVCGARYCSLNLCWSSCIPTATWCFYSSSSWMMSFRHKYRLTFYVFTNKIYQKLNFVGIKEKIVCFQYSSDMIFYNHFHKGKTIILRRSKSGCALQSQSCKNYGAVV